MVTGVIQSRGKSITGASSARNVATFFLILIFTSYARVNLRIIYIAICSVSCTVSNYIKLETRIQCFFEHLSLSYFCSLKVVRRRCARIQISKMYSFSFKHFHHNIEIMAAFPPTFYDHRGRYVIFSGKCLWMRTNWNTIYFIRFVSTFSGLTNTHKHSRGQNGCD